MEKVMRGPTIFIHGQESSSLGTKAIYFRKIIPEIIIPDFVGALPVRMSKLHDILRDKKGIIMVGSSLGGLMAALYAFQETSRLKKLILLAPAINLNEFSPYLTKSIDLPVHIFHGSKDEVIPLESIREISSKVFKNLSFVILEDDHRFSEKFTSIDWIKLLEN